MAVIKPRLKRYLGVIGEGSCSPELGKVAYEVGANIAKRGAVLVCGGLGGVMVEAARGAKEQGGLTIGILPGFDRGEANPYIDIAIVTGLGEARNILVVRNSDAVIAVGGMYGTLSEIAFALKLGIPLIGLGTWHLEKEDGTTAPIIRTFSPEEAVELALRELSKRI